MKTKLAVAVLTLAFASAAMAQSKPITVRVVGEPDKTSQQMANRLMGQIGSSNRYALVTENEDLESILLGVECVRDVIGQTQVGISCDINMSYWPVRDVALSANLTGGMATGDESSVAQNLFDDFVEATSDEKLSQAASRFRQSLNVAIKLHPNGVK
jgi:hypothetical protein